MLCIAFVNVDFGFSIREFLSPLSVFSLQGLLLSVVRSFAGDFWYRKDSSVTAVRHLHYQM